MESFSEKVSSRCVRILILKAQIDQILFVMLLERTICMCLMESI